MPNLLAQESSPYLLSHAHNPVDWRPWGEPAFAEARARGVPVLLSIGYDACHWCHVMARECFENPEIARAMNEGFVCVKVDREERPDLDHIYQSALALMGQPGGWPLTMFLTPNAEPFWGGTYFPPADRFGRPGFPTVLAALNQKWREERDKIGLNVERLRNGLAGLAALKPAEMPEAETLNGAARALVRMVDPFDGGFGTAPKFPHAPAVELLFRAGLRTAQAPFRQAFNATMTAMAQGGIYDHIGGGFARYATDEAWNVPHFEKMLYDNAQLIALYTLAWQDDHKPIWAQRVRETIDWVLTEMTAEGDAFASALAADSEGEEGRFYIWTAAEIDEALGAQAETFKRVYGVTPYGNWPEAGREGQTILNRRANPPADDEGLEAQLAACRAVLLARRARRVRPSTDDKVTVDANGLMIAALAEAGFVFGDAAWIEAADAAFTFITGAMQPEGRLRHCLRDGRPRHPATLDDYAALCRAGLKLYEVTGEPKRLDAVLTLIEQLERHFADPAGGYWQTGDDVADVIVRARHAADLTMPSGNAMMVQVLTKLWLLTGADPFRARAEGILRAHGGLIESNPLNAAGLVNAAEGLMRPVQIVVIGESNQPGTWNLVEAIRRHPIPDRLFIRCEEGSDLPPGHPAAGKTRIDGRPTAYVCVGPVCSPPITHPIGLAEVLNRRKRAEAIVIGDRRGETA